MAKTTLDDLLTVDMNGEENTLPVIEKKKNFFSRVIYYTKGASITLSTSKSYSNSMVNNQTLTNQMLPGATP